MRNPLFPLIALVISGSTLSAQPQPLERWAPRPSIRATGEATVTAKPDRAIVDLGVVSQAQTAQAAAAQNATHLDAVLRALTGAAGNGAEIKTVSYSLDPNYRYPKPGGQPELAGYTARNTIQVTTADLGAIGKIIDAATQAGANNVERLQFTLKDDRGARAQALREAAVKARANAEAIAAALSVKISGILFAEEGGGEPVPIRPMYSMARTAEAVQAPTPVAPGAIEVHGTVTLTVEIVQ
jgi:uncharacterized protein YggE